MDDMADLIGEARGKKYFDRFRALMGEFSAEETDLMEQRLASNARTVAATYTLIGLFIGIGILIGIVLAWFIGNGIARPIAAMTETMLLLSKGDYAVEILNTERRDEIGAMAEAVLVFKNNAIERDRLEKQLRQAQKMEAIGQLTGGIAHDFNNILGIVMGNLQLLQRQVKGDPVLLEYTDEALEGVRRGADITEKLLGFSHQEPGGTKLAAANGLIADMRNLIARSLTAAITVETDFAVDLWLVEIEPGDLEDALLNLSLNARDAMPDGGTLLIETDNKVLDENYAALNPTANAGEFVMIAVTDTGTGMTEAIKEKAFEPFFTTKGVGQGSGLGLSMVYGFVERSGGHIKIYTELGAGTTFRIYLPRAGDGVIEGEAAPPRKIAFPRGTETVLVVDDEKPLRNIAVSFLEDLGYKTLTANDGESAMDLLNEHHEIDLLFCDVIMPGNMDGYQVALAAHEKRPDLKTLLTSGFTRKREEVTNGEGPILSSLTRNLLSKPYNDEELAFAVRRTLDGDHG
jgi:signal transduction histidine kinase/ActR/RegA family two-component response regulator